MSDASTEQRIREVLSENLTAPRWAIDDLLAKVMATLDNRMAFDPESALYENYVKFAGNKAVSREQFDLMGAVGADD